ncbi:hypothetical protein NKR23_g2573 [Pleurostoma richardsiae]|uniref:Transcription initiation factor TFIID subunit 2 n=1 Tax=Pleurostoma richardsiae TaxID=41990 RepID=A0AA38S7E4_9PEZI|nr:hypothetical protein NKR23_g2573 [Pleurostoma richardsiae]
MPGTLEAGSTAEADPAATGGSSTEDEVDYEPFVVLDQSVELEINFREKMMQGKTTLKIFLNAVDDVDSIYLDARQAHIDVDNVTVNGKKVKATYNDPYKFMDTPKGYEWDAKQHHLRLDRMRSLMPKKRTELPMIGRESKGCMPADRSLRIWLHPQEAAPKPVSKPKIMIRNPSFAHAGSLAAAENKSVFHITIPFCTKHIRDGVHFVGVEPSDSRYPHVYTRHSFERGAASCIFPCVDDRSKTNWNVALKFPRTVGDALRQPLATQVSSNALANGASKSRELQPINHRELAMTEEDKLLELTAICSGNLIGEHTDPTDETKKIMEFEALSCGAQHVGFAIGPFQDVDLYSTFRSEEDDEALKGSAVKVHGYCLPGREDEVRNTCAALALATDFFALTFGKYPFDSYKLCYVEDMVEDTVPLQSFSLCSSRLLFPEDIIDMEIEVTRKLVHSLASQYFGIYITANERTDSWIVVGIAYYMTDLFMKKLCGNNHYRFQQRLQADRLVDLDLGRPSLHDLGEYLHLGDFEMKFMATKAPLVLFILDRRLLKASNTVGLTRVISAILRDASTAIDNVDATPFVVSSEKFRKMCEKKGRLRLEDFWSQWVMGAGCPRLVVTQKFNKKRLCVEMLVRQEQAEYAQKPRPLDKDDFWRDLKEDRNGVYAGEVQLVFTGPMTFRVHEADGTPYEHLLEVKLDAAATKGSRLEIGYNTKYKRLKKSRQKKKEKEQAKALAANAKGDGEKEEDDDDDDDSHVNVFGDVLVTPEEMADWKLVDWDLELQKRMDEESYEWIRVDTDFEWICQMTTNLQIYMTVSQLQQDRDIAAQVEAMLTIARNRPSNIQTTVLLRTLYDRRYYHGIRSMAAEALSNHAHVKNGFRGMWHLMRVFQLFYCYPESSTPRPNDFSNKAEYMVRSVIPSALARIRGGGEQCPMEARRFILEQLIFNDNENNPYSDHFYVAKLLEALASSLVRTRDYPGFMEEDVEMTSEKEEFLAQALEQIERYQRMDEWASSYQNIWTVTALECKQKLMKSGVIPVNALDFVQYLTDETLDLVQIKAFECLIELELMLKPVIMRLLITTMSTHSSPFVRDRLFKAFCRGLAAIAIGEHREDNDKRAVAGEEDDSGLIIEQDEAVIQQKKADIERKEDISRALDALREALKDNQDLQRELWKAIDSPIIGLAEKRNLLELCATMFDTENSLLLTLEYPKRWTIERGTRIPGKQCAVIFKAVPRTSMKRKRPLEPEVAPPPAESKPPEPKKIKIQRPPSFSVTAPPATASAAPPPPPPQRQPSISVAAPPPLVRGDSISVLPVQKLPPAPVPKESPPPAAEVQVNGSVPNGAPQRPKLPKKRKSDEADEGSRTRKMFRATYNPRKLSADQRKQWASASRSRPTPPGASTIVATPVKVASPLSGLSTSDGASITASASSSQPTPGSAKPARKPLPSARHPSAPNGATSSSSPSATAPKPRPQQPSPQASRPAEAPPAAPPATPATAPKPHIIKIHKIKIKRPGAPPTPSGDQSSPPTFP